jgi:hypothetical protein
MKKPTWTVEVLTPNPIARVRLGINWGDGRSATPVEIDVPSELLENPEAVGSYYLGSFGVLDKLKQQVMVAYNINPAL